MRQKIHDIQWPVTAKTIEEINSNFDFIYDALNSFEKSVSGASVGLHDILSFTHPDSTKANVVRGDIITGQGTTPKWTRLAKGTAGTVLTMGAAEPAWAYHTLLGATHSDTVTGTCVRGDVITGSPGNQWQRLAKGTTGTILTAGATDISWTTHAVLSASHTDATAAAVVRGDVITGQGATPKWTRLALSVPAATFINVLGVANGETESSWKALFDATVPTTIAPSDAAATGSATVAARRDHVHGAPATYPPTAHALLSASHSDTTPSAPLLGDLIVGIGGTPAWTALAMGGPTEFLHSTPAGLAWVTISSADLSDVANIAFVNVANVFTQNQEITLAGTTALHLTTTANSIVELILERDELAGSYNVEWFLWVPASSTDLRMQAGGTDWFILTTAGAFSGPATATIPTIYGSAGANGDLTLEGTSHGTKTTSYVILQPTGGNVAVGTTTPADAFSVVGHTNLGNSVGNPAAGGYYTRLSGRSITDGATYYGSFGALFLHASGGYTGGERRWLITNALDATKFSIIRSVDATTDPSLGTAGALTSGTADVVITNAGLVGFGNTAPTYAKVVIDETTDDFACLSLRYAGSNPAGSRSGLIFHVTGNYGFLDYHTDSSKPVRLSALGPLQLGTNTNAAYGASTFTPAIHITTGQLVGINTAAPAARLAINGGLHVGGDSDPGDNCLHVDDAVGIGAAPVAASRQVYIYRSGAKTAEDNGAVITSAATSSTASISKAALRLYSTGTWDGSGALNVGLFISTISGGTRNYAIYDASGQTSYFSGNVLAAVGCHVGGTTDPGNDNLVVDGRATIGAAISNIVKFKVGGNFVSDGSSNYCYGNVFEGSLTGYAGDTSGIAGTLLLHTHVTQTASESIGIICQLYVQEPVITNNLTGGGVITTAATLYVAGAPTEGAANYAVYVTSGLTYLAGTVRIGSLGAFAAGDKYVIVDASGNLHVSATGPAS